VISFYPTASEKSRENGDSVVISRDFLLQTGKKMPLFCENRQQLSFFRSTSGNDAKKDLTKIRGFCLFSYISYRIPSISF
jgi:hypothetical protein